MHLKAFALRRADRAAADVAGALRPLAADPIAVGRKLPGQVEIVAVAGTAQVEVDLLTARTARPVVGIATDAFGCAVAGLDGAVAAPGAGQSGERSALRQGGQSANAQRRGQQNAAEKTCR